MAGNGIAEVIAVAQPAITDDLTSMNWSPEGGMAITNDGHPKARLTLWPGRVNESFLPTRIEKGYHESITKYL
ncbi:hypothetical protein [Mycobacteroides abscessus]|uniref:hypothetical protein n=1 Tax=Mycobacteroides abscessus TaxID=36809 RepID=UPI000C25C112|nr:hypothetical protein [Mycobacteroides abscessus]